MSEEDWWSYIYAAGEWKDLLSQSSLASMRKYGRYSENITAGLRLIAVNTVLYYSNNYIVLNTTVDPAGQFAWIRSELAAARAAGQKVFIAGHLPPGFEVWSDTSSVLRPEFTDKFAVVLDGFHDIVAGSFWGHVHIDSFKIWADSSATGMAGPASPVFLAPSLEPEGRNPVVRLFAFDDKSYDPLDYTDFWYDVETANKLGKLEWTEKYRPSKAYGTSNLTVAGLRDLYKRMQQDDTLFQRYNVNLHGMPTAKACTGVCKKRMLCAMYSVHSQEHANCIATTH